MISRCLSFLLLLPFLLGTTIQAQENRTAGLPAATPKARTVAELAAQTIVVFNENDLDSTALAGLYVEKRGIPPLNLIGLRCPRSEEITRSEFDSTIAEPLRQALQERGLWKVSKEAAPNGRVTETKVRFAVLMHGMPLRVAHAANYEGDNTTRQPSEIFSRNECAVDSELAVLGLWNREISGVLMNPYFQAAKTIEETEITSQLLVCRLDGPSPAVVRRMLEDSLAAEKSGLRGFTYVDARGVQGGALEMGDKWFHALAKDAREHGLPVIMDNGPALFPDPYPMRHAAGYFGWYSEHVVGPFTRESFRFVPGAVTLHLHSFSAVTLRDKTKQWCAPLLAAGAAATLGNVYEPYLGLTPQPDILWQRLREGFTLAEAGYMSQRALSWMTTVVGDPLYRPFANHNLDPGNEWDAYRLGVKTWLEKDRVSGETALRSSARRLNSGIIAESLGLLELFGSDHRAAITAFEEARRYYTNADDRIRVAVHEAGAIATVKSAADAARFLKEQAAKNGTSENAILLSALATTYVAPPVKENKTEPGKPPASESAKPDTKKKPAPPKRR